MLKAAKLKRIWFCSLIASGAVLAPGCSILPSTPLDQPISLSVRDGEPVVTWCGGSADLVRVRLYYGTASEDDAQLVLDASGQTSVVSGDEVALSQLPDDWKVERKAYAGTEVSEVGVTLEYTSIDGAGKKYDGGYLAEFEFEGAGIESWPTSSWQWANGQTSSDACGMPSSVR